jgi:hypothetical protein
MVKIPTIKDYTEVLLQNNTKEQNDLARKLANLINKKDLKCHKNI